MANTGKADFPTLPAVTDEQLKNTGKYDAFKTMADIFTGKLENSNGKNLTLHIDVQFQKLQPNEMATSENSTTVSGPTELNGT
ncbi:hypothetical protein LOAG_05946 [Loa loa]|uniref:Replication initiation protein n=1 Tax=Loa loa TaxID=7209 RepID=A0A1I7W4B7_LOALO|nr:hypothetical protein LOAG_05946 [Loa loa]EFO22538.2 hypothetical protein LOAG_05946 [Loa loa]